MKNLKLIFIFGLLISLFSFESCGPVIVSSRPSHPTPPWFYPNRVVNVRYVYFPDYLIYYDITLRSYLYLDNGIWISVNILPPRYRNIDLRRTSQVRIDNYFGNNIREYHPKNTHVKGRRTSANSRRRN